MKTMMFMLTMAIALCSSYAHKLNEDKVPEEVKTALQKRYPEAEEVKWDKEDNDYEASFELDDTDFSVLLDSQGGILETEEKIEINQLPAPVVAHVNSNYPKTKIKEAARIVDSNGTITYEAETKGKDLIFDEKGNLINEL